MNECRSPWQSVRKRTKSRTGEANAVEFKRRVAVFVALVPDGRYSSFGMTESCKRRDKKQAANKTQAIKLASRRAGEERCEIWKRQHSKERVEFQENWGACSETLQSEVGKSDRDSERERTQLRRTLSLDLLFAAVLMAASPAKHSPGTQAKERTSRGHNPSLDQGADS